MYFLIHCTLHWLERSCKYYIDKYDKAEIKTCAISTVSTDTVQLLICARYNIISNNLFYKLNRIIMAPAKLVIFLRGEAEEKYDHTEHH